VLTIVGIGRIVAAGIPAGRILIVLTRTGSDAEAADHRMWIEDTDIFGQRVKVAAGHIPERIAYRQAISRGLTLREAQPASLRRIAGSAIDEIIAAVIEATTAGSDQERGAA